MNVEKKQFIWNSQVNLIFLIKCYNSFTNIYCEKKCHIHLFILIIIKCKDLCLIKVFHLFFFLRKKIIKMQQFHCFLLLKRINYLTFYFCGSDRTSNLTDSNRYTFHFIILINESKRKFTKYSGLLEMYM